MKTGNYQGEDGITAEAFKEMGEMGIIIFLKISKKILNIGQHQMTSPCLLLFLFTKKDQCGFIPRIGTRENIFNLRQIIETSREFSITTYLCFVDHSKAFDKVKWHKLWGASQQHCKHVVQ